MIKKCNREISFLEKEIDLNLLLSDFKSSFLLKENLTMFVYHISYNFVVYLYDKYIYLEILYTDFLYTYTA